MKKTIFIKDLLARPKGDFFAFEDQFLLGDFSLHETRNKNSKFLSLGLSDKTGNIRANIWDRAEHFLEKLAIGQIYDIKARLSEYKGEAKLTIEDISPSHKDFIDIEDYFKSPPVSRTQMLKELKKLMSHIQNPRLAKFCKLILDDGEMERSFSSAPGAKSWHHAYPSGLLAHTLAMAKAGYALASFRDDLNGDFILSGILAHDIGKIRELCFDGMSIEYTKEGRLLGHISIGIEMIAPLIKSAGLSRDEGLEIMHILVSHHGLRENGSPQVPMTPEAFVIHFLDNMDAQLGGISNLKYGPDGFSDYCKILERYLYFRDNTDDDIEDSKSPESGAKTRKQKKNPAGDNDIVQVSLF